MDFISEENNSYPGKLGKRTKSAKKKSPEERIHYATRGKKHSYCEAEVPDDDHYIFCEECQDLHYGDCPVHGPLQIIEDRTEERISNLSSAVASLPTGLKISNSSIPEQDEQNLVAYQFRGEIYYRTYKAVNPGEEVLVWYGESYAKDLGISLSDNQENRRKGNAYTCEDCTRMYTSINVLQRHKCSSRTKIGNVENARKTSRQSVILISISARLIKMKNDIGVHNVARRLTSPLILPST
ncbi:Histone-lysine N-methyltransferase prdm9 [Desmophyllum pertusum]|uniref:Histone-lysine N-methyltransferase prdm9 n=1 Tax=Desmophyllum pertusum TaxID=174260 RepID=A0A9W9ZT50_9CNID|nr:Histone-lysine N-methyltransferase prdm9 [Desmophyllum pertusum]